MRKPSGPAGPVKKLRQPKRKGIRQNTSAKRQVGQTSATKTGMKTKAKKSRAERFLTGGVAFSCIVLCTCLLSIFSPVSREDGIRIIKDLGRSAQVCILGIGNSLTEGAASFKTALFPSDSPSSPALAPQEPASPSRAFASSDPEEVSRLIPSDSRGYPQDLYETPDQPDQIYSVMLDTAAGPMLYYNQGDIRWAEFLYGGQDPMKKYGCGPTAIAMVINSFTNNNVTPVETAIWAAENGYYAPQSGSYHSLIPDGLSAFGLCVKSVSSPSVQAAEEELAQGHLLVALMGRGALTQNGHFIIIVQDRGGGDVYIADPNSFQNSTLTWSLDQLVDELKGSHDSGGPLWAVWPPDQSAPAPP